MKNFMKVFGVIFILFTMIYVSCNKNDIRVKKYKIQNCKKILWKNIGKTTTIIFEDNTGLVILHRVNERVEPTCINNNKLSKKNNVGPKKNDTV